MSTEERNTRTVRRLFDDVWNGRRLDAIDELYSDGFVADYRPYAPLRHGRDGARAMVDGAVAAFPDYHEELLAMCAQGSTVVVHLRISGTHLGNWGRLAPTGRTVQFEEMLWLTFDDDGRVVHQRGVVDNLLALRQIGILPAPTE